MGKAIKSLNEQFYRIDYICGMTGLHYPVMLAVILMLAVKLAAAQSPVNHKSNCKLLKEGKISEPVRQAHKMPSFPGGDEKMKKFIKANFKHSKAYPKQGTIYIAVVINPDGTISGERVLKGINGEYNREALRVLKMMPKWTPGECDEGEKVAVEVLVTLKV